MCELATAAVVAAACPALAQAARAVGDPQVRNRATAGGNLCNPDPVSDIAPVLLAADGAVVLHGVGGRTVVQAADFFDAPLGSARAGQVIVELRFGATGASSAFEKLSRRAADAAVASAAAFVRMEEGVLTDVGLGLCAVHERPVRAKTVEDALRGRPFDPDTALALLRDFCMGLNPPDTVHADANYRREAGPVIATRALARAIDEAGDSRNGS
jgi:carbon-monoxide dehydrogenase medium subunit